MRARSRRPPQKKQAARLAKCPRVSAEQGLELGLDLGLEALGLLLAAQRFLALAAERGLDLIRIDAVRVRDQVLGGADVLLDPRGGQRAEAQAAALVDLRLDQVLRPRIVRLP